MEYKEILEKYEDEQYLVNMVSVDDIIRFGCSIGLNENSRVLDLCCGYGTMLKIWNEVFEVSGKGVDIDSSFIKNGALRLTSDRIDLSCGDVLKYDDCEKYDVVICTELSTGLFNSFGEGIVFLERFLKPNGVIVFGKLFSELDNPPQELIDFDGSLPTLSEIYDEVRQHGYLITSLVSGTDASWERYIIRDSKQLLTKLREAPQDESLLEWTDKWHKIYYDYRRPYENWALFGIEYYKVRD
jgi:SAM-dependent methyltransferase